MMQIKADASTDVPGLVLGGAVTALAVLRSLGRAQIPVYCVAPDGDLATYSRWHRPLVGHFSDAVGDEALSAVVERLPVERAVLFPCSDHWASAAARISATQRPELVTVVASPGPLEILLDKALFARTLDSLGVPHPRTLELHPGVDLAGIDRNRFFIKPCQSERFSQMFGTKALHVASGIESVCERAEKIGLRLMLQEYIPGPATAHVFLDGYVARSGSLIGCLARRRLRAYPAPFGNSTLSETIPLSDTGNALPDMLRLFEAINFSGLFDAEFVYDARDGVFRLLEVNARPWWQLALAADVGLDLCLLAYRDALGLEPPQAADVEITHRWANPLPDLAAWWQDGHRLLDRASPPPPLAWLGATLTVFSRDDPRPAGAALRRAVTRRLGRRQPGAAVTEAREAPSSVADRNRPREPG